MSNISQGLTIYIHYWLLTQIAGIIPPRLICEIYLSSEHRRIKKPSCQEFYVFPLSAGHQESICTQLQCAQICPYTAALVESLDREDAVRAGMSSALLTVNFLHVCMVRASRDVCHLPHGPRSCVHSGLCFERKTGGSSKREPNASSKKVRCPHSGNKHAYHNVI